MKALGRFLLGRPLLVFLLVTLAIVLLPIAVWLDLRNISDQNLRQQATSITQVITAFRSYYATNVVNRIIAAGGHAKPLSTYRETDGGIPIPATLSIEMARLIGADGANVGYRFVSRLPFHSRQPYPLDDFEKSALATFEADKGASKQVVDVVGGLFDREIRVATPVVMAAACVDCHNKHPDSPRHDWKVGDVRGIQAITVRQPLSLDIGSFKWLLAYLATAGSVGLAFALGQFGLAREYNNLNSELELKNAFLGKISGNLSKYLSPQIYKSIFLGQKDVEISTERKKLTVFFSDIKDFTATTERLQPEELTTLLNEYFSEMSHIAEEHGATIDKFIGDAIVAFFGDPVTRGVVDDAKACVRMAIAMQERLAVLNEEWRRRGFEQPFRARMGINTGYCNVGNFGSTSRMDYTIIGAEANLAARLEEVAKPGGIVLSYETWALVSDSVKAVALPPTRFKGVSREVIPYEVILGKTVAARTLNLKESEPGYELSLSVSSMNEATRSKLRDSLRKALDSIEDDAAADRQTPASVD